MNTTTHENTNVVARPESLAGAHRAARTAEQTPPGLEEGRPFDSPQVEVEAGRLGVWLVVLVEIMIFGVLLAAYAVLREARPEVFTFGGYFMESTVAAIANAFLLVSGFGAVLAVHFGQTGKQRNLVDVLALTFLCGLVAVGIKGMELEAKADQGLLPGRLFSPTHQLWERDAFVARHPESARHMAALTASKAEDKPLQEIQGGVSSNDNRATKSLLAPLLASGVLGTKAVSPTIPSEPKNAHTFFGLYFFMNALLLLHLVVGLFVWAWMFRQASQRKIGGRRWGPLDCACVFWNMGALVSVVLFPLFYLV